MNKEKIVIKEKERYEITDVHFLSNSAIFDTETNGILVLYQICDLLNDYFKRIKELEQENQQLKQQLAESEKPKEIKFNGFVIDCNYNEARKVLQENLLKMQAENKKLKESEELSNYAKCILKNKKLEEDFEHLHEEFVDKCNEFELKEHAYKQTIYEKDQDKISFAIEQIMQIKEKICNSEKIGIGLTLDGIYELYKIFDNQTAELTNQLKQRG